MRSSSGASGGGDGTPPSSRRIRNTSVELTDYCVMSEQPVPAPAPVPVPNGQGGAGTSASWLFKRSGNHVMAFEAETPLLPLNGADATPISEEGSSLDEHDFCIDGKEQQGTDWSIVAGMERIWKAGSECILMDLTFNFVWSKPLFFMCLLTATMVMGEENLYSNSYLLRVFPSSTSCLRAHQVDICDANGTSMNISHHVRIPVNYIEDSWFQMEVLGWRSLSVVVAIGFANSRYFEKMWRCPTVILAALIFFFCFMHAWKTTKDLWWCGGQAVAVDWTGFSEKWMPTPSSANVTNASTAAGEYVPDWAPPVAAQVVEEYCDSTSGLGMGHLRHQAFEQGWEREEFDHMAYLGKSVKDMWVAWMDAASFVIDFQDTSYVKGYCQMLAFRDMQVCLRWLNQSSFGNHIDCERQEGMALENLLSKASSLAMKGWEAFQPEEKKQHVDREGKLFLGNIWAVKQMMDEAEMEELKDLGCKATVSGSNFGVTAGYMGAAHTPMTEEAIAFHLLSLATRGLQCPADAAAQPLGPAQVPGSLQTCKVNTDFVSWQPTSPANQSYGPRLLVQDSARDYVRSLSYMQCATRVISNCAGRARARYLTTFRSASQAGCAMLLLAGYMWMSGIRLLQWQRGRSEPSIQSVRAASSRILHLRRQAGGFARALRPIFTSRVVVGLVVAFILELGFMIVTHSVMEEWLAQGRGKDLAKSLQIRPLGLIDGLMRWSVWLQLVLMTGAVIANIFMHLRLRKQLMGLPAEVFFGRAPLPPGYHYTGPDLNDLRFMGRSSVVYAMYFPGMVFWHLFYSSWLLVLMTMFFVGLLIIVFQPSDDRSPYANDIWVTLTRLSFFLSVLLAHFITRMFTQRCLIKRQETGMHVRCLCLFSWYEVFFFLISFAIGPSAALYDFMKAFLCTMLASLIVQKPNFTQFGELADYVYCTYCAALYLERVGEEKYVEDIAALEAQGDDSSMEIGALWSDSKPMMMDEQYTSKRFCLCRTLAFWLLFLGLPSLVAYSLMCMGTSLGYSNPELSPILS